MAIIQISQIKHKRGLRADLPFSLEEGELGLTLDTGELFIGTPNLPSAIQRAKLSAQQYFPFKNTQILTEWTDNVKNTLNYRYRFRKTEFSELSARFVYGNDYATPSVIYTNSSGFQTTFTVSRKLQERLDESVSIKSYGAVGNGQKDFAVLPTNSEMNVETIAIRKAVLDVSNVTNIENQRGEWKPRALFFPAGVYCINDSLLLPPNSYWYGEGTDNTIIALCSSPNINLQKGFNDCLMFTVDNLLQPENANSAVSNYSYQNLNSPVKNIFIRDITFLVKRDVVKTGKNKPIDIIRLIGASDVVFYNCQFIGNWSNNVIGSAGSNYEIKATSNSIFYYPGDNFNHGDSIGVVIDSRNLSLDAFKSKNIQFINCNFKNTTYGSLITDDVDNIKFINCSFNRHYRGISISEPVAGSGLTTGIYGPKNIYVENSIFRNIKAEGIYIGKISVSADASSAEQYFNFESFSTVNFGSLNNIFENVGNNFTNNGSENYSVTLSVNPTFPVISFSSGANYCYSICDNFSRSYVLEKTGGVYGKTIERIKYNAKNNNIIINTRDFFVNPIRNIILSANTSGSTGLKFDISAANTIFINYSLGFNTTKRMGNIRIISDSTTPILDDDYIENSLSNFSFNVVVSGTEIEIYYDNNSTENATFNYYFNYWHT